MKRILIYTIVTILISITLFNKCAIEDDKIDYYIADTTLLKWSVKFNDAIYSYSGSTDTIIIGVDNFEVWSPKVNYFIDSTNSDTIIYGVDDFEAWRNKFNIGIDSVIAFFGSDIIFNADFRTGRYIDFVSGDSLLPLGGGLPIESSLYGPALTANNTGYLTSDSIYNLSTGEWTFDFAVTFNGFDDGSAVGQFATTLGYNYSWRVFEELAFFLRNPSTELAVNYFYERDSTYHFVITKDVNDSIYTYINNDLSEVAYAANVDMQSTVNLFIAARSAGSFIADSCDIYYVKIYEEYKDDRFVANSFENFQSNYFENRVHFPDSYTQYGSPSEWVMYFHGNGGDYTNDPPSVWLDSLIDRGFVVCQTSGSNHWGNDYGQNRYRADLYNYITSNFNVNDSVNLLSSSMGALADMNILIGDGMKAKTSIFISAAINLDTMYYGNNGLFKSGIRNAYVFTTDGEYEAATAGYNPHDSIGGGGTTYPTLPPVYWMHGDADIIAPISEALDIHNALVSQSSTFRTVVGATHSSTSVSTPTTINEAIEWLMPFNP